MARLGKRLSALTLVWLGIEGVLGVWAGIAAGSIALVAFGLDSAIEGLASVIVIWRFTGSRILAPTAERYAQRLAERLGSGAVGGEGKQNLFCAVLAAGVLVGLAANTILGLWWLDPAIALAIAAMCVREGSRAWRGEQCGCASCAIAPPTTADHCECQYTECS